MDTKTAVEYVEKLQKNISLVKRSLQSIILTLIIIAFFAFPSVFYIDTIEDIIVEHLDDEIVPHGRVKNAQWHFTEYLKDNLFTGIFFWIGVIFYFSLGSYGLYFITDKFHKKEIDSTIHIGIILIIVALCTWAKLVDLSMSYF